SLPGAEQSEIDPARGACMLSGQYGGIMAPGEQQGRLHVGLNAAELLHAQVQEVHRELEERFNRWLLELAPAAPPKGSRAVELYVHAATVEDVTIHSLLRNVAPLYETDWAGTGPAHYSTPDLAPLLAYERQVFAATDVYLAGLSAA